MQMKHFSARRFSPLFFLAFGLQLVWSGLAAGQDALVSQRLTDAIYRGDGVIDLFNDLTAEQLAGFVDSGGGRLLVGVDVNENKSGNESRTSLGVAIEQIQLAISTSEGDFTFSDFYTNTTAVLRDAGSGVESEFYTLFGQSGRSQITGGNGFDLATYDDVLWIDNISLGGATILGAELRVTFLETPNKFSATEAESFFDFSGGFEDFALLNAGDAIVLEEAATGVAEAPSSVVFSEEISASELLASEVTPAVTVIPGAPLPPLWLFGVIGGLTLVRQLNRRSAGE